MGEGGRPEGVFAKWSWEGGRFHLQNDRHGFYPLFYSARAGQLMVSTSIPKLLELGAPRDVDDTAMAVFLRLGFFLGEDTPFRFIRAVPPQATFQWEAGALHVSGHQNLGEHLSIDREKAVDEYISLFRQAIERRLVPNEEFALPLSGGRDSRHILLELCRIGHKPSFCVTYRHFPPRNDSDLECAVSLSARLGIPHVVLDQPESRLKVELRKNLKTSFCSDEHAEFMVVADYLRHKVRVLYDGIGAVVFMSSGYLKPQWRWLELTRRRAFTDLAREMLGPNIEPVFKDLLSAEAFSRFGQEAAISRLAVELERVSEAPNPPGAFHFWNRQRREISLAPYAIYDEIPWVLSPFLDHALCDFLFSLPAEMLLDRGFKTEAIQKAYPHCADLPFETVGQGPLPTRQSKRFARELLVYAAQKGPYRLIRRSYLLPRLAQCQLLDKYCASAASWLLTPRVAYLVQLDRVTEGCALEPSFWPDNNNRLGVH